MGRSASFSFRPLVAAELPLLHEWLGRVHVERWWGARGSYQDVVDQYLPSIDGRDPTDLYAIVVGERPVGLIQTYLLGDYPEYAVLTGVGQETAGLDVFLADVDLIGRGLGSAIIASFVEGIVFARAETRMCVADPDVRNLASIRAFEKAGFSRMHDFLDPEDGEQHALVGRER